MKRFSAPRRSVCFYGNALKTLASIVLAAGVAGCSSVTSPEASQTLGEKAARDADDFKIVDCLLPGQVRKLGAQMTFLTPRRPVKTSAVDCEIRGGEYVAYDRADYSTALKVWLPLAQQGDPAAQTYVGEIYEKGLGLQPDYTLAAQWYRKAAEQGYARAQINLGHLREKGLGVEQDLRAALNWYRRASGLVDDELQFASSLQAVQAEQQQTIEALRVEVAQRKQQEARLRTLLHQARQQLQRNQQQLNERQQALQSTQQKLEQLKQSQPQSQATGGALVGNLQQQVGELTEAKQRVAQRLVRLQRREATLQRELGSSRQDIGQLEQQLQTAEAELKAHKQQLMSTQQELAQTQTQLERQRQLAATEPEQSEEQLQQLEQRNRTLENQRQRLEQLIAQSQQQREQLLLALGEREQQLARSQQQLRQSQQQRDALQQQLAAKENQLQAVQQQLQQTEAELASSRAQYEQELELFARETQAHRRRRQVQIAALEQELQQKQTQVTAQKEQIMQLQQDVQRYDQQLQTLASAQVEALPAPPSIEIIEPPIALTRGSPSVRLTRPLQEREVIGKVLAPAGLMSFQVNGKPESVENNNLFHVMVPVRSATTPVEIVAVDRRGRRVVAAFSILTEDSLSVQPTEEPQPVKPVPGKLELGNYHALVIGNNDYASYPNLKTAINDARATERILRERYGFKTTLLIDANRYDILSALNRLRQQLGGNDNLLIYYAGHGELDEVNERGFWLPVDAEPDNSANWISNIDITDIINAMQAKQVMVVADSCYSGTLSSAATPRMDLSVPEESRAEWIEIMSQVRARTVLTSGGIKPVLDSGGGEHSIFARAFLETLRTNNRILEGYALYSTVLRQMQARAAQLDLDQVPSYAPIHHAGHEAGEFFFQPARASL